MQTSANENVRLEISAAVLTRLLTHGHLQGASELRCTWIAAPCTAWCGRV